MNDTLQREPVLASIIDEPQSARATVAASLQMDAFALDNGVSFAEPLTVEQRLEKLEKLYAGLKAAPVELEERITAKVLQRLPESLDSSPRWYQRMLPFRKPAIPEPSGWIVFDLLNELRFVLTMLLDRRFAMSWTSRGIVAASLAVALTASFWSSPFALIPFLGSTIRWLLETLLILFAGGLIFKIFHREALRYRNLLENMST